MSDTLSSPKATPAVAFCFLLNQLLERERWARERLEAFAGESVEVRLPLLAPLRLTIAAGGRIEEGGPEPAVCVSLNGVSGSAALADELRFLARHLRWDAEEELSRFVGDIAARRLVQTALGFARWQRDAALRIGEAIGDYAAGESRALVRRGELHDLSARLGELQQAIATLEQRIARLD